MRLIGDRSTQEKDFGKIELDIVSEMQKWADSIKTIQDELISLTVVAANNHYAGFGPGTVNIFRNMLGLPEATWHQVEEQQEHEPKHELKHNTLSDLLS